MIDLIFKNDVSFYENNSKKLKDLALQLKWGNPLKFKKEVLKLKKAIDLLNMVDANGDDEVLKTMNKVIIAQISTINLVITIITNLNKKAYETNND